MRRGVSSPSCLTSPTTPTTYWRTDSPSRPPPCCASCCPTAACRTAEVRARASASFTIATRGALGRVGVGERAGRRTTRNAHGLEVVAPDESPADLGSRRPSGRRIRRARCTRNRPRVAAHRQMADARPLRSRRAARRTRSRDLLRGTARPVVSARYFDVVCRRNGEHAIRDRSRARTCCRFQTERSISPAPMPSTSASATCAATSPPSAPLTSRACRCAAVLAQAAAAGPAAWPRARARSAISECAGPPRPPGPRRTPRRRARSPSWRGTSGGNAATQQPAARPARAPSPTSDRRSRPAPTCSTSSCRSKSDRATRRRPVRTASSRARSMERPRTSVPRFTAPSSRMRPTATSSSLERRAHLRRSMASCSAAYANRPAPVRWPAEHAAHLGRERPELVPMRTPPWRPAAVAQSPMRTSCGCLACRAQTEIGTPQVRLPAEELECGRHHARSLRMAPDRPARCGPSTDGSAANCWRHNRSESTTTRSRPGVLSPSAKVRPRFGCTCSSANRLSDTFAPVTFCGSSVLHRPAPSAILAPGWPLVRGLAPAPGRTRRPRSRQTHPATQPPTAPAHRTAAAATSTPRTTDTTSGIGPRSEGEQQDRGQCERRTISEVPDGEADVVQHPGWTQRRRRRLAAPNAQGTTVTWTCTTRHSPFNRRKVSA